MTTDEREQQAIRQFESEGYSVRYEDDAYILSRNGVDDVIVIYVDDLIALAELYAKRSKQITPSA